MAGVARERREAIRQLADLRRRLAAAEDALTDAVAAMKAAEGAFDAASDRFDAAEVLLMRSARSAPRCGGTGTRARQAHERASVTADRLARRVRELSEHLDRMPLLPVQANPEDRLGVCWKRPAFANGGGGGEADAMRPLG